MKKKPEVGQILYSLNIGNAARNREQKLTPVAVTKVGRKYFTCKPLEWKFQETQFHIEDWREKSEYTANEKLYESEQEWLDEKEADDITRELSRVFDIFRGTRFSLDQLRRIHSIVKESEVASNA